MTELRFRQVHLDFHTSGHIAGIGSAFDADEFAATLEKARVDSVTCFARCHHGYVYYDTRKFADRRHPHLRCNLLKEQIDACHARDIRVPIYVTVQWDHLTAEQHPEWLMLDAKGAVVGTPPFEAGFYRRLCLNSPYVDWLAGFVEEVLTTLPVDGFFFDIVDAQECCCAHCRAGMVKAGLEPSDPADRRTFALDVYHRFMRDMTAFVRRFNSDCTIFYNAGHVGPRQRPAAEAFTHFELESLPSGGWGYMHFPVTMRYARTLGKDCLGMTGKFHTAWGDFHSFKNPAALEFECFNMLALGAKCSIGDQLHPEGRICPTTYALIGSVYSQVERKEPWCRAARPLADVGVLTPEEFTGGGIWKLPPAILGATRLLQEGAVQFDILPSALDFAPYKVLVLPDDIPVSEALAGKIEKYVAAGGKLLASFESGLCRSTGVPPVSVAGVPPAAVSSSSRSFALNCLGVEYIGPAPYEPDFIVPTEKLPSGLPATEHVMYLRGLEVRPVKGAEVLAGVNVPYFNRTYKHFCSHKHTPSAGKRGYPGIVANGPAVYFAHPVFTQYHKNAPLWVKKLVLAGLNRLLPEPLLRVEAPSATLATLHEQRAQHRRVLHLLHYVPERRGQDFDTIEDVAPIRDVKVWLRADRPVARVACVPDVAELEFRASAGRVEFVVPEIRGHQIVEVQME